MRVHGVRGIADQHGSIGDPGRGSHAPGRHIGGLTPIGQVPKHMRKVRRDLGPGPLQGRNAALLDGVHRSAGNHVEHIHLVACGWKQAENLFVADIVERLRHGFLRFNDGDQITFGIEMHIGRDLERLTHSGESPVGTHDKSGSDGSGSFGSLRRQPRHPLPFSNQSGERGVVPQAGRGLFLYGIDDGVMRHVRQSHDRSIVGRRQIPVVDRAEASPAGSPEVEVPHGSRRLARQ